MGLFDTEIANPANNVGDMFKNDADDNKKTNNEKKVVKNGPRKKNSGSCFQKIE